MPGSLENIPAGFGCVMLSMRVAQQPNVIPSLVGPLAQPTLNVSMECFDGRHRLADGRPAVLGVDEVMHMLAGAVMVLTKSLPATDLRQQWCYGVVQSWLRLQQQGRAPAAPSKPMGAA